MPASQVTAAAVAQAYKRLEMAPGSSSEVTMNFVDVSATICKRILNVPAAVACQANLYEKSILQTRADPLDSHTRLQAIVDKCKSNDATLHWVLEGIWYHWLQGHIDSLSKSDLKGTVASTKGFLD